MPLSGLALPAGLTLLVAILPHIQHGRPQIEAQAPAAPRVVPSRADIIVGILTGTNGRPMPPLRSQGPSE